VSTDARVLVCRFKKKTNKKPANYVQVKKSPKGAQIETPGRGQIETPGEFHLKIAWKSMRGSGAPNPD